MQDATGKDPSEHMLLTEDSYTDDSAYTVHEFGLDLSFGHIFLFNSEFYTYGAGAEEADWGGAPGVEYTMANKFIKNLVMLQNQLESNQTIVVHLNTPGGCWTQGMAIYNALKHCPNNTVVLNYAEARSMSSLIALAADYLVMMPEDSRFMFHTGTFHFGGTGTQLETEYREWKISQRRMEDIYIGALQRDHGKWKDEPEDKLRKWIKRAMKQHEEVYLNPVQAYELGFAHAIFDGDWEALAEKFED